MKKYIICFVIVCAIGALFYGQHRTSEKQNTNKSPFSIEMSQLQIVNEEDGKRLTYSVSIDNITSEDYKDVWYQVKLNDELKPFLAAQILDYTSDKMNVTTKEKAKQDQSSGPVSRFRTN